MPTLTLQPPSDLRGQDLPPGPSPHPLLEAFLENG